MLYQSIIKLAEGQITQTFLVKKVYFGETINKKPFTGLLLTDKTADIKCVVWESHLKNIQEGCFIQLSGEVKNGIDKDTGATKLQIISNKSSVTVVKTPENLADYTKSLDELTRDKLLAELNQFVQKIQDTHIKTLVEKSLMTEAVNGLTFKYCPLSEDRPANYAGALLENTVYVLRYLDGIYLNSFDRTTNLNSDILIAGAILMKIGAIECFESNLLLIQANVHSKLLINDASLLLVSRNIPAEMDPVKLAKILHIVSNPEQPRFIEALVISDLWLLSLKMDKYANAIQYTKSNQQFSSTALTGFELFTK